MITPEELLSAAKELEPQLREWRRTLHRHPEVGFDLPQTKALVKKALTEMGYAPQDCGRCGVLALAGGKRPGKTILLRGDMDALPIQEESGEEFASEIPGRMHGCGHDMHTAMMLGAAKLAGHAEQRPAGKPEGGRRGDVPRSGRDAPAGGYGAGAGRRHHHGKLRAVPHHRPRQGRPRLHA